MSLLKSPCHCESYLHTTSPVNRTAELAVHSYMAIYFLLVFATISIYAVCWSVYVYGTIRASRILHKELVMSILGTTLR